MTVYLSEIRFENPEDFAEVVATDGEDLSGYSIAVYNETGVLAYSQTLTGDYVTTIAGRDVFLADRSDGLPDMGQTWGVALIDDLGNVVQFVSGEGNVITASNGPAAGHTSYAGPVTSGGQSIETSDFGATYYVQNAPNPGVIVCFAEGTLIDTPGGPRPVEEIRPGDLVTTLDHGPQPVLWTRASTHWLDPDDAATSFPILIPASALGPGRPGSDLVVSPQHRILLGGQAQLAEAFEAETLVAAKALTGRNGIREMRGRSVVTWVHFAFAGHEIVVSNGCLSESLLLGPMVRAALGPDDRRSLAHLFAPGRSAYWNGPPARPCIGVSQARQRLAASGAAPAAPASSPAAEGAGAARARRAV